MVDVWVIIGRGWYGIAAFRWAIVAFDECWLRMQKFTMMAYFHFGKFPIKRSIDWFRTASFHLFHNIFISESAWSISILIHIFKSKILHKQRPLHFGRRMWIWIYWQYCKILVGNILVGSLFIQIIFRRRAVVLCPLIIRILIGFLFSFLIFKRVGS